MKNRSRPQPLSERILALLKEPGYQPLDKIGISKALQISSSERREVRDTLRSLEERGDIARIRKDRYVLPTEADLISGIVEIHRNGHAHLLAETPGQQDISISAEDLGTAMHRDRVLVRLNRGGRARRGAPGASAQVIRILARATDRVVGLLQESPRQILYVVPDDPRFRHHVYVRPGEAVLPQRPRVGDKVVVKLAPWDDPHVGPEGEIVELLGPANAPGIDMLSIVRKYGLPTEFPADVVREAENISEKVDAAEAERRVDLRDKLVFTIDPDDARDFDDAIHLEPLGKRGEGGWRVGIHIADVSHYVRPGMALDREAEKRGNSTYLVDRVIPMLPERLSNGICSLKPGVERLTFSAFLDIAPNGRVKSARFAKTIIRSAARLSYRQAFALLEGKDLVPPLPPSMERETRGLATLAEGEPVRIEPAVANAVREAWKLAAILRKNRFEAGSLDLEFPEVKIWLDGEGKAVRLERQDNDISHQLIEEYMLAANEAVARELKERSIPAVYRVHEDPSPERLADFRDQVRIFGIKAGDLTNRDEVQKTLAALRGMPEEYALKLQFLKSLKRAVYGVEPLGHYGLAKVNYTHFTSPIRRYADLLVHRALERAIATDTRTRGPRRGGTLPGAGEMAQMATHISATERISADAEMDSIQLKKMEYFQRQLASKKPDVYRAIVTDARSFGLLIELPDVLVNGLIHVSALPEDFYNFDPVRSAFIGKRSGRRYQLGDELQVIIARVDAVRRLLDFAPVAEPVPGAKREGKAGKKKERGFERRGKERAFGGGKKERSLERGTKGRAFERPKEERRQKENRRFEGQTGERPFERGKKGRTFEGPSQDRRQQENPRFEGHPQERPSGRGKKGRAFEGPAKGGPFARSKKPRPLGGPKGGKKPWKRR